MKSKPNFMKGGKKMKRKETNKELNRRDFIKTTALGAGAVALAGLSADEARAISPGQVPNWDLEADVLVVGFGGAGGAAALEAHDAGAKVLILERTPTPGGATSMCAGIIYAAGTSLQRAEGIADTPDEMYKYWMAMGKGLCNPEQVRILADKAVEAFEWFKQNGVEFYTGVGTPGVIGPWGLYYSGAEADPEFAALTAPKVRGHTAKAVTPTWPFPPAGPSPYSPPGGTAYFKCLYEGVKSRGIEVLLETRATALIADPITHEALGVKAQGKDNKTIYVKASRAVVLSSGGFAWNKEMCTQHNVDHGSRITASSAPFADLGDGIKMGQAIGADVVNMDQGAMSYSVTSGAILVNNGGRRFVDETLYRVCAEAMMGQRDSIVYAIFDEAIRKAANITQTTQAATVQELAGRIGMDPSVLQDTVDTYNASVAAGKDAEFGRTKARHHADPATLGMVQISTPPFHAVKVSPTVSMTTGGLRINAKAQVVNAFGKVIPRLCAAGRVTGGGIGEMYAGSGASICDVIVFGRVAGKTAAAETPW
jgi:3-oxo-5alpha-steroid 4-dehydrogenase